MSPALMGPALSLIETVQQAPKAVLYRGTRTVELYLPWNGSTLVMNAIERVTSDGKGGHALETLQVSGDLGTDSQSYIEISNANAGFVFEYRDFNIRSLPLFVQNYQMQSDPVSNIVAGRDCLELRVMRLVGEAESFVVDIDKLTGLVLAYRSYAPNGVLVAHVEYQTIDYQPDLSNVALSPPVEHELLDLANAPEAKLGFVPLVPKQIPTGFQFARAMLLDESPTKKWACLEYLDGVESVFFLHGGQLKATSAAATGQGAKQYGSDSMTVYHIGLWTVAQGMWQGERLIVLGRLPKEPLLLMVESALP